MIRQLGSYGDVFLLTVLWAPALLLIRIAVEEIPPISLVALRLAGAALFLSLWTRLKRISLPNDSSVWFRCAVWGFLASALPFTLLSYSLVGMESIYGNVILGAMPITTAILGHYLLSSEQLSWQKAAGFGLGFMGILVLSLPSLMDPHAQQSVYGLVACIISAMSYSCGMVYAKLKLQDQKGIAGPTMQMITSACYMTPLALFFDRPWTWEAPSSTAWICVGFLTIPGTALAFVVYLWIVARRGPTHLSQVGYIIPILGTVLGATILGEHPELNFYMALLCIMLGLAMVQSAPQQQVATAARGR